MARTYPTIQLGERTLRVKLGAASLLRLQRDLGAMPDAQEADDETSKLSATLEVLEKAGAYLGACVAGADLPTREPGEPVQDWGGRVVDHLTDEVGLTLDAVLEAWGQLMDHVSATLAPSAEEVDAQADFSEDQDKPSTSG